MIDRIRLRLGLPASDALRTLNEAILAADRVQGLGGDQGYVIREQYVTWVEETEARLASLTHDRDVVTMLQSERYWQIRGVHQQVIRPHVLVTAERDLQKA